MLGDPTPLNELLDRTGADGYLIEAGSESADQGYLSGFWAPDPYVSLYVDGKVHCLVKPLELGRAREESRAASVENVAAYDFFERLEELERHEAWASCISDFCDTHEVESIAVPSRFPHAIASALIEEGISVTPDYYDTISTIRATKMEVELEAIAEAQAAAEAAMATAQDLLEAAVIDEDETLVLDGEPLTSESVKSAIERTLLEHRCALDDTIVACGAQAADPHDRGSGPLQAHETIIIDIFPRHKESRYFGDLTRTFVKGTPSETHQSWYDLTLDAQTAAFDSLRAGITGEDVHYSVCDVYESAGHATLRADPETETGFIHSTGHGVGLEIHEQPSLSQSGEELGVNQVVTVEPGLYDPGVGGVRIEDLVVVTEDGFHNVTEYPKQLQIE